VTILFSRDPELVNLCERIAERDPSFRFTVKEGVQVYSETKDKAYRRGMWLRYHLPDIDLHFQVLKEG